MDVAKKFEALWIEIRKLHKLVQAVSSGGGGSGISTLTGDVAAGPGSGSQSATIAANAVTNTKLADMAQATIKGRAAAAGTGDPTDLTANQTATVLDTATDPFIRTSAGYTDEKAQDAVGAMVDTTLEYVDATPLLRRAALTGDVTATSGSNATTIANDAVTNAKAANMAADTLKGRAHGAGTGDPTDLTADQASAVLDTASDPFLRTSAASGGSQTATIGILIDGGTAAITTGVKGFVRIPVACTLTGWTILSVDPATTSGSIVIDVWKDTYTNFPPTNADSITNGHEPTVTTSTKAEDTNITDWTSTAVSAGDVIGFNVDSITAFTKVLLQITATVP